MSAAELAETALSMKNVTFDEDDSWTTFEVIENGELGAGNRVQPVLFIHILLTRTVLTSSNTVPTTSQTWTSYVLIKMH